MSLEKYTKATQSSDLAWREWECGAVDWLTAAGMVWTENPLAGAVARLFSHQDGGFGEAFNQCLAELERPYGRRIERQGIKDLKAALRWFYAPSCGVCWGRGHPVEPDAPILKDEDCLACHGTGLAPHVADSIVYADALKRLDEAAAFVWWRIAKKVA